MAPNGRIKILGMEFPIKKWAVGALSVIAVGVFGFMAWKFVSGDLEKEKKASYSYRQMQESASHFTEPAQDTKVIFDDTRGKVQASFYASDSCVVVARYAPGDSVAYSLQWIFDRKRAGTSPGPLGDVKESSSSVGLAFGGEVKDLCGGACLDPHPLMRTKTWWGKPFDKCWVPYYIRWEDYCEVYRWYNKCYGIWGAESYWTCCVH